MLVILDYKIGNLSSIKNMLSKAGEPNARITNDVGAIREATKLILPGVGSFDYGMEQLRGSGFYEVLNQRVLDDRIPVLGICLGVQLLTEGSDEGNSTGLGWIRGQTVAFDKKKLTTQAKIPHMGWTDIVPAKKSRIFADMHEEPRFYFVHSYHLAPSDPSDVLVNATYCYEFAAGVERDNIIGVQFHPEKSHKYGMKFLSNFVQLY